MKRVSFARIARLVVPVLASRPGLGPGSVKDAALVRVTVGELPVQRYTRDYQRAGETDDRHGHNNE